MIFLWYEFATAVRSKEQEFVVLCYRTYVRGDWRMQIYTHHKIFIGQKSELQDVL